MPLGNSEVSAAALAAAVMASSTATSGRRRRPPAPSSSWVSPSLSSGSSAAAAISALATAMVSSSSSGRVAVSSSNAAGQSNLMNGHNTKQAEADTRTAAAPASSTFQDSETLRRGISRTEMASLEIFSGPHSWGSKTLLSSAKSTESEATNTRNGGENALEQQFVHFVALDITESSRYHRRSSLRRLMSPLRNSSKIKETSDSLSPGFDALLKRVRQVCTHDQRVGEQLKKQAQLLTNIKTSTQFLNLVSNENNGAEDDHEEAGSNLQGLIKQNRQALELMHGFQKDVESRVASTALSWCSDAIRQCSELEKEKNTCEATLHSLRDDLKRERAAALKLWKVLIALHADLKQNEMLLNGTDAKAAAKNRALREKISDTLKDTLAAFESTEAASAIAEEHQEQ